MLHHAVFYINSYNMGIWDQQQAGTNGVNDKGIMQQFGQIVNTAPTIQQTAKITAYASIKMFYYYKEISFNMSEH